MDDFQFDEATHEYRVDGRIIPSVTQILQGCGISNYNGIDRDIVDHKAAIGKAVHLACEFYDKGILESVPDLYTGYVEAYKRAVSDLSCKWDYIEHRRVATVDGMQFGMQLDRLGMIYGSTSLVEIKATATEEASWAVQLAGYHLGMEAYSMRRYALWLKPDGKYRLLEYKDKRDFKVFRQALSLEYWKRNSK